MKIGTVALKVTWVVTVSGALVLLCRGLLASIYFEPTSEAIAKARHGAFLIAIGSILLIAAAAYAAHTARWPLWIAVSLMAPVVLCGGLTVLASESLLPQLAALVAYPPALAAGVAGLVLATPQRPPARTHSRQRH